LLKRIVLHVDQGGSWLKSGSPPFGECAVYSVDSGKPSQHAKATEEAVSLSTCTSLDEHAEHERLDDVMHGHLLLLLPLSLSHAPLY